MAKLTLETLLTDTTQATVGLLITRNNFSDYPVGI